MKMQVKMYDGMGRGVECLKPIAVGEVVEVCEVLVLNDADTIAINNTVLQHYTFKLTETQDCLVLGMGELYNHSFEPNVGYSVVRVDGRPVMQFIALQNIYVGQQLFIDYSADVLELKAKYNCNAI